MSDEVFELVVFDDTPCWCVYAETPPGLTAPSRYSLKANPSTYAKHATKPESGATNDD